MNRMHSGRAVAAFMLFASLALPVGAFAHGGGALRPTPFASPRPGMRIGDLAWSVAMHLHASFSEGDGSFDWHTEKAAAAGLDVIWWSEHDWRALHSQYTTKYDFERAVYETSYGRWSEPDDAFPEEFRYWQVSGGIQASYQTSIDSTNAFEGQKCFALVAADDLSSSLFRRIYFQQTNSNKQNRYSLASRMKVSFALFPQALDADDAKFVLEAELSIHPEGVHRLRYVVGSMEGEAPEATPLPFTPNEWNVYTVDLTGDAIAKFTAGGADTLRGEDNNLHALKIGLEVRNGRTARVLFDDLRYICDTSFVAGDVIDKQLQYVEFYESRTPEVRQIVGTEISKFRTQPHMNAFTPTPMMVDYGSHGSTDLLNYAVDQVHAAGGAVSLNHLYGTGVYGDFAETPEERVERIRIRKIDLITKNVYDADILEVGYRWRGGVALQDHLGSWDALTGNGIYLTGTGVTDGHGTEPFNGWGPRTPSAAGENNFTTWLYASRIDEVQFIDALLGGRAFFGDPSVFDGSLDLATGEGFAMGRIVLTDRASHELVVAVEPVPATARVRLLQGEIRPGLPSDAYLNVNWIRDEILDGLIDGAGAFADTVTLNTTAPTFARVEVTTPTGELLAYSNPIHFVRDIPSSGIKPQRVAGLLGPIEIRSAKRFLWKSARFDSTTTRLVLGGDETPDGGGEIVLDCGVLGDPGAVVGAASRSFDAGILTLGGFAGDGSTIDVMWGPVAVTPPQIREVTLGPGRPNPFQDGGVTCEFALPSAGNAKLVVLDVAGRLVRVLVDAPRDAGIHRAAWDGADERGKPAANGVYFLRLEAGGRVLTSKAVKTR